MPLKTPRKSRAQGESYVFFVKLKTYDGVKNDYSKWH